MGTGMVRSHRAEHRCPLCDARRELRAAKKILDDIMTDLAYVGWAGEPPPKIIAAEAWLARNKDL
jgi:hypothetical protein